MRLRVGVIGPSELWERRYRPALHALREWFEVRSVYSPVTLLAEKAARRFRADTSHGIQQLVRRPDIDAVLVLATDWLGIQPILAACSAGKAVYSAAALELDLAQANLLQQHVQRSGIAYMAEFARRHAPATVRLKELIATRLGAPRLLFCHHRAKGGKSGSRRRQTRRPEDAAQRLRDLVDWCCYVVGAEPQAVLGIEHCLETVPPEDLADDRGRHDYRLISLDFSSGKPRGSGPIAQISFGSYLPPDWPEAISFRPPAHLQVCCEHGAAFIDLPSTVVWFDEAGRHMESLEHERPVGEQMLLQFHRAVTSLILKRNDLEDACRSTRIMLAAQQSAREGRWLQPT
jgi:predicted dehydrogenase